MDITWYGHSCFRITERNFLSIVTDPFDESLGYPMPKLKADIVTISHNAPGHNNLAAVKGFRRVIDGPGEYEIKNIFITGIAAYHDGDQGKGRGKVTIYLIELEGLVVCHLGDLGHVLAQSQIEQIGRVDVLLAPVGGGNSLNAAQAAEVISLLEPRLGLPMHSKTAHLETALDPLTRFIKEMGARSVPQRNPIHPALRLEHVEPGQPYVEITRSGDVPAAPEPPVSWTCRMRKG